MRNSWLFERCDRLLIRTHHFARGEDVSLHGLEHFVTLGAEGHVEHAIEREHLDGEARRHAQLREVGPRDDQPPAAGEAPMVLPGSFSAICLCCLSVGSVFFANPARSASEDFDAASNSAMALV